MADKTSRHANVAWPVACVAANSAANAGAASSAADVRPAAACSAGDLTMAGVTSKSGQTVQK